MSDTTAIDCTVEVDEKNDQESSFAAECNKLAALIIERFPTPPVLTDDSSDEEWNARYEKFSPYTPRQLYLLHTVMTVEEDTWMGSIVSLNPENKYLDAFTHYDLPAIAQGRTWEWMARMSVAYGDLARDIEKGIEPTPRCVGERIALWSSIQIIQEGAAEFVTETEGELNSAWNSIPEHPDDDKWDDLSENVFSGDYDIYDLLDLSPEDEASADEHATAVYGKKSKSHPRNWFLWFRGHKPRPAVYVYSDDEVASRAKVELDVEDGEVVGSVFAYGTKLTTGSLLTSVSRYLETLPAEEADTARECMAKIASNVLLYGAPREQLEEFALMQLDNNSGYVYPRGGGVIDNPPKRP